MYQTGSQTPQVSSLPRVMGPMSTVETWAQNNALQAKILESKTIGMMVCQSILSTMECHIQADCHICYREGRGMCTHMEVGERDGQFSNCLEKSGTDIYETSLHTPFLFPNPRMGLFSNVYAKTVQDNVQNSRIYSTYGNLYMGGHRTVNTSSAGQVQQNPGRGSDSWYHPSTVTYQNGLQGTYTTPNPNQPSSPYHNTGTTQTTASPYHNTGTTQNVVPSSPNSTNATDQAIAAATTTATTSSTGTQTTGTTPSSSSASTTSTRFAKPVETPKVEVKTLKEVNNPEDPPLIDLPKMLPVKSQAAVETSTVVPTIVMSNKDITPSELKKEESVAFAEKQDLAKPEDRKELLKDTKFVSVIAGPPGTTSNATYTLMPPNSPSKVVHINPPTYGVSMQLPNNSKLQYQTNDPWFYPYFNANKYSENVFQLGSPLVQKWREFEDACAMHQNDFITCSQSTQCAWCELGGTGKCRPNVTKKKSEFLGNLSCPQPWKLHDIAPTKNNLYATPLSQVSPAYYQWATGQPLPTPLMAPQTGIGGTIFVNQKAPEDKKDDQVTLDKDAQKFRFKSVDNEESNDPLDESNNPDGNGLEIEERFKHAKEPVQQENDKFNKVNNPLIEGNSMTPDQLEKFKSDKLGDEGDNASNEEVDAGVDTEMSTNPSGQDDEMGGGDDRRRFRFRQI